VYLVGQLERPPYGDAGREGRHAEP
jgi:hypothetical protein